MSNQSRIPIKSPAEIAIMAAGGKKLAAILDKVCAAIRPGMKTMELEVLAAELIEQSGGQSTFKGFHGYPAVSCVSVNDEVVHGIPGERVIQAGDIVGVDLGLRYQGFCTDTARTVAVGSVSKEVTELMAVTQAALKAGIDTVKPGARIGDISAAIESVIIPHGYGIVRDLAGHGIGRDQWEEPSIHNFGKAGTGPILKEGMVIAIEPMVTLGTHQVKQLADDWTIVTADGSWAAHYEHTVAVTATGHQVLT